MTSFGLSRACEKDVVDQVWFAIMCGSGGEGWRYNSVHRY
jgi:hypothetical protein